MRLKYDHPSGLGRIFKVGEQVEAPGFYRLYFRYQVDSISKFQVKYTVIAHFTEFEIVE